MHQAWRESIALHPPVNLKNHRRLLHGKGPTMPGHIRFSNQRRSRQVITMAIACAIAASAIGVQATRAAIPWATWAPTTYTMQGWSNPPGARVTGLIPNFLFSQENANANDTVLYSELIVDAANNTVLLNYIDLEGATASTYTSNPFDQAIPAASRATIDGLIAAWTPERFTGSTLWDLIKFTFQSVWKARMPESLVSVEIVTTSGHEAVLLDFEGTSGIGRVLFVNLGVKAAIMFDAGQNSAWGNVTTFTASIQAFVTGFLDPLATILHAASVDQLSIVASAAASGIAGSSTIHASGSTSFLNRTDFLSLASWLMSAFPVPTFPFRLSWNQVVIIIAIVIAIGLVVYYGITSYASEKKKIPDNEPKERPWYS